jgi:L-fuconolactonase
MNRRTFLAATAASAVSAAAPPTLRIIDTHTHFYDTARAGGVPWPPKGEKILYRPVLPAEYIRMTKALGVVGTIEVEASPLMEDNQWVLDLAAKNPILVGTVGDIDPAKPGFGKNLERYRKNPLFRGIRIGTIWDRYVARDVNQPQYIPDLKLVAEANLGIDVVGDGDLTILPAILKITDKIPALRVVIDHVPFDTPKESKARAEYESNMREIAKRPLIFAKISNVLRKLPDRVPADLNYYRPKLDELWELFGPDRVVYGSNWPVSDRIAPFETALNVVREYFAGKGPEASDKYFYRNSKAAYRWMGTV